jgi:broad specificity phosphatase PhoE
MMMASWGVNEALNVIGMKTIIYLIRHGESDWNIEKRIQGQMEGAKLSEKGQLQSRQLKKGLEHNGIRMDLVYSSPLRRALETAKIAFPDQAIRTDDRLQERSFGKLEGMTRDDVGKKYPELTEARKKHGSTPWFEGSEKLEGLAERGMDFLRFVVKEHPGKHIAVVFHGGILEAMLAHMHGMDMLEKGRFEHDPTGYTIIEYEGSRFTVKVLNHNAHLKENDDE